MTSLIIFLSSIFLCYVIMLHVIGFRFVWKCIKRQWADCIITRDYQGPCTENPTARKWIGFPLSVLVMLFLLTLGYLVDPEGLKTLLNNEFSKPEYNNGE